MTTEEQREQFILVNSTKPLPKGLIYELLPTTEMKLPTLLERRTFPAQLLSRLNSDSESPLKGKIKTPTTPSGVVQDNSILKMLENSLSDGVLYRFRDSATNDPDVESMLRDREVLLERRRYSLSRRPGVFPLQGHG